MAQTDPTLGTWSLGLLALAGSGLLLIGFLTPFAAIVLSVDVVGAALALLPVSTPSVFDSQLSLIFALTMLLTIIGTGPGRFSVDARVFGRREIIIPPVEFPSER
jgi:uncharacterized membrane protein YphA (DoxX/SURF4 family)